MSALDRDFSSGSIADTNSATVEISASEASRAHLTIDDGTTGNNPSQYTITVRAFNPDLDRFQFVWDETSRTDRAWAFDAVGSKLEVEITNTSGASDTFEIMLEGREYGN